MAWDAKHAAKRKNLQAELERPRVTAGRRVQIDRELERIAASEPPRDYAVSRCVQAWCDLSTCRPVGMAVGVIPWTSIVTWCDYHGFDREATDVMIYVIRQLDADRIEAEAKDATIRNASGKDKR